MGIKRALQSDSKLLTQITINSKSSWGYSKEQIVLWEDSLTVTPDYIKAKEVYKLSLENNVIGYYSFFELDKGNVKLDNMFLHPDFIGKGFGKIMMIHFLELIKSQGFEKVVLDADPNAELFYKKFGFRVIGQLETSVKNRFLPVMEYQIPK